MQSSRTPFAVALTALGNRTPLTRVREVTGLDS
jgi:hypothetical protein